MVLAPVVGVKLAEAMSTRPGFDKTLIRWRRWQKEFVTEESAKETVKTIACGNAGCCGVLVVTRVRSTTIIAHETAGALGIRRSPRPLWAEDSSKSLGRFAP